MRKRLPSNPRRVKEMVIELVKKANGAVSSRELAKMVRGAGLGTTDRAITAIRREMGEPVREPPKAGRVVAGYRAAATVRARKAIAQGGPSEEALHGMTNEYLVACTRELNRRVMEAAKLLDLAREE